MEHRSDAIEMPRREFLRRVGAAGIAVTLGSAGALEASAAEPPPAPPPPAAPPETPSEDAQALAGILRRRYPDRLTPEQWEAVTRSLGQRLETGRRLASTTLANGDEPDFTFRA